MSPTTRLLLACAALSAWMILLLTGHVFGGAVHLLLAVMVGAFPRRAWVAEAADVPGEPDEPATELVTETLDEPEAESAP